MVRDGHRVLYFRNKLLHIGSDPVKAFLCRAASHQRLDRALEAELERLASASPAHQEDRYRAGVVLVAGILRQLECE